MYSMGEQDTSPSTGTAWDDRGRDKADLQIPTSLSQSQHSDMKFATQFHGLERKCTCECVLRIDR